MDVDDWPQTLLACTTKRLLKIKGFSDVKVEKIKEAAKKLSVGHPLNTVGPSLLTSISQPQQASSLLLNLVKFASVASGSLLAASNSMLR
jgi:hypothetical protein